jgi:hypothetical protein
MTEQKKYYARYPFIRGNQALWKGDSSEKGATFRQAVITSDEWAWDVGTFQLYALEGTGKGISKGKFSTEPDPRVLFDGDFKSLEAAHTKFDEIVKQAEAEGFRAVTIIEELEFQANLRASSAK